MIQLLAAFAQHERQAISTRTKDALQTAKRRGIILGKNGQILAKENKANSEKFLENIKPIINEVKQAGFTTARAIVGELNKRKVQTYYFGSKWHRTTVQHILQKIG